MRTSRIATLLLPLAAMLVLHGCGGSSDSDLSSVQGNVADGYLQNARVCLDLNGNRTCDDGEPADSTDAEGAYRLEGVTPRWLDEAPIIAEVIAGTTINHEDGGAETVEKGYILSTPPGAHRLAPGDGRIFISPLTSMVHERMISAPAMNVQEAADFISARVATGAGLFEDYIALQTDSAEYARLHRIARATAVSLGAQMALFATTAQENGMAYDSAGLYAAALHQVRNQLSGFATGAEVDEADFDPESVVEEYATDPDAAAVRRMMDQAATTAVAAVQRQVYEEGLYDLDLSLREGAVVAEYLDTRLGAKRAGGDFDLERSKYRYDPDSEAWAQVSEEEIQANYHLHLTPGGWEPCYLTIEQTLRFEDSTSALWTDVPTGLLFDERMSVRDISGRSINAFLPGNGAVSAADTAKFPEGSLYYDGIEIPRQDVYTIYPSLRKSPQGPFEGITSVGEIPERVSLPSSSHEIRQVMGEEILIVYQNGSADSPHETAAIIVLRDGELWGGYLDFAGVPQTFSSFNRTALDAMTAAVTASSP